MNAIRKPAARPKMPPPGLSLADLRPEVVPEWHPTFNGSLQPSDVTVSSGFKVWWLCLVCANAWSGEVARRSRGHGCPDCGRRAGVAKKTAPDPGQSLADLHPLIAGEWHSALNGDKKPENFKFGAKFTARWVCRVCAFEWTATINARTSGHGCPTCGRKAMAAVLAAPKPGQSFAELHPEAATEWNDAENGDKSPSDVSARSGFLARWVCTTCQFGWSSTVANRAAGHGCPACGWKVIALLRSTPLARQSLADLHPLITAEWHPTENGETRPGDVKAGSGFKGTWTCRVCAHTWSTQVYNRTKGSGCPNCANAGFNNASAAVVYFLTNSDLAAHKVGIAGTDSIRIATFERHGWKLTHVEEFSTGAEAREVEKAVHRWWRKDLELPVWLGQKDTGSLGGWTETISADELTEFEMITRIEQESARVRAAREVGLAA